MRTFAATLQFEVALFHAALELPSIRLLDMWHWLGIDSQVPNTLCC